MFIVIMVLVVLLVQLLQAMYHLYTQNNYKLYYNTLSIIEGLGAYSK